MSVYNLEMCQSAFWGINYERNRIISVLLPGVYLGASG